MPDLARARAWLRQEIQDDREEWAEMTARDYAVEAVRTVLALAIIYRVTAQVCAAAAAGVDLDGNEPEWSAFNPVFPDMDRRVDMAGRLGQSLVFLCAAGGWAAGFGGGLGAAVVIATNVGLLIVDPAVLATDYVIYHAQNETY